MEGTDQSESPWSVLKVLIEKRENRGDFKSLDHCSGCGSPDSSGSLQVSTAGTEGVGRCPVLVDLYIFSVKVNSPFKETLTLNKDM